MNAVPEPTPLGAVLAWAGRARDRRTEVVAAVASGATSFASVVGERQDPLVGGIKLVVVLQAVPDLGKVGARRMLAQLGLEDRRVGELSDDDADRLVRQVLR